MKKSTVAIILAFYTLFAISAWVWIALQFPTKAGYLLPLATGAVVHYALVLVLLFVWNLIRVPVHATPLTSAAVPQKTIDPRPEPAPVSIPDSEPVLPVSSEKTESSQEDFSTLDVGVSQFSQLLSTRPDARTFSAEIVPVLENLFPGCNGALHVFRHAEGVLHKLVAFGESSDPESFLPADCIAFSNGKALLAHHPDGVSCAHLRHHRSGISLCVPVRSKDDYLGTFSLHGELCASAPDRVRSIVDMLTGLFAIYLVDLDLREKFQVHSIRDPLTGMFNRKYMEESLVREVAAAHRRGTPIGLILVAPDSISMIHSTQGAQAADQLLWELGQRLIGYIRTEDIPCRFADEVLCVLMPGAGLQITHQRAERILSELGALEVIYRDTTLQSSLSLGVAVLPVHGSNAAALVSCAEDALALAREKGGGVVALPG